MKNVNPVGWFDLYVADLARAKRFYETVFSIQLSDLPPEWGRQAMFPADEQGLNISGALVEKTAQHAAGNNTVIYFVTDDCVTEEGRVEAAGGKILQSKMAIGEYGFMSLVMDTEGNTIGLHSRQ
ncbi:lactoylglutathione lyase [Pedobacter yulinensis]|uniref:Lactoylglutathione lyase n=1 Tax=Pedobacter yulinensis TaxID=2126353 RepID=A0A2T3HL27_9SPHI|nr:VOC family protein [Pedobacter yulinensis]PST83113.1 lactoylglutathione lyase [Pedobacter yulinensis]